MKARVLIVEDEREISELIALYLGNEGIETFECPTAEEAMERFDARTFQLVVLDINLPGMDGYEFLSWLRARSDIPVVIVSARDTDEDTVLGLGIGADDFVTKPFSPKILVARIRANLRRYIELTRPNRTVYTFGPFTLDSEGYFLEKSGEKIQVPAKELALLLFLIENTGKSLSPDTIYREIWGSKYGDLSTVAVHVQRLRGRIESNPKDPEYIKTVYGHGYRFDLGRNE